MVRVSMSEVSLTPLDAKRNASSMSRISYGNPSPKLMTNDSHFVKVTISSHLCRFFP